jgi:hypothetical protein
MSSVQPFSIGQLLAQVAQRAGAQPGLVVHVGAGATALDDHADTRADQLVLVEGDPDTAAGLLEACRQHHPAIQVVAQPVAAISGPLRWRRYNLSSLNGPLDAGPLRAVYPRLREIASLNLRAEALGPLLQRETAQRPAGGVHVLVLELPGQEQTLLGGIDRAALAKFDWVIVRGCREAPGDGWAPVGQTRAWLAAQAHYDLVASDDEAQVFWPWSLHRFDAQARERDEIQRQLTAAHLRSRQLEGEAQVLKTDVETLMRARVAADQAAAEQMSKAEQLGQMLSEERALAAELRAQMENLAKERLQLVGERDALVAENASLIAARDEQRTLAARRQAQIESLTAERLQLIGERDALALEKTDLTAACDKQRALAAERLAQVDSLTAERLRLIGERDALAKAKSELSAARDEQSRSARDAKLRVARLDEELVDTGVRFGLLQEELVKAEAQIELIADLLLRDPHR